MLTNRRLISGLAHQRLAVAFVAVLCLTIGPVAAEQPACTEDKSDPASALDHYDDVFLGRVIALRVPVKQRPSLETSVPYTGSVDVDLEVVRVWKGSVKGRATVVTGGHGDAAFPFQMTRTYLVWAKTDVPAKGLVVPRCSRTSQVEPSGSEDRPALDREFKFEPIEIPSSAPALICCCGVEISSPSTDLARYDAVFVGDVVAATSCSKDWGSGAMRGTTGCTNVDLLVRRVFRGSLGAEVGVRAGDCAGNPLELGRRYLVWSRRIEPGQPLQVSSCATAEVAKPGIKAWVDALEAAVSTAPVAEQR